MIKSPGLVFILLVVILLHLPQPAQAERIQLDPFSTFAHIGSDEGLPNIRITDIHQDHQGFIWIGTEGGLCRYDGYRMHCFTHTPGNPNGISDNVITSIISDTYNRLWVGTSHGLNLFDRQQETFRQFLHTEGDSSSIPDNHVLKIIPSQDGHLLIETLGGFLTFFDPEGSQTRHIAHATPIQPYYRYHALFQDSEGDIWLGGRYLAMHHWESKNQKLNTYQANIRQNFKRENDYAFIFQSEKGQWYVGGVDGFYFFCPDTILFERIFGTTSYDIKEDCHGLLWVGTGSGLARFDPSTGEVTFFRKHPNNPNSLIDNSVNTVFIDQSDNIWAGTSRGISLFTIDNQRFRYFYPVGDMEVSPASALITALYEDDQGHLWIGTEDRGISIWDEANQTIRHLNAGNSFLLANHISAFFKDAQENLWIGLWAGMGFHRYDEKTRRWATYRFDPYTRKRDWYNGFWEDSRGDFWLAFWGAQGLKKFDRATGSFSPERFYVHAEDSIAAWAMNPDTVLYSLSSRLTTTITEDNQANLWVGTSDAGLNRMCPERKQIEIFNPENSPLPSLNITALHKDQSGNIWIGTTNGMAMYHANHGTIIPVPEITRNIRSILEDDQGLLWMGTIHGLVRFDPASGKKWYYSKPQGLITNEFNKAALKRSNGSLVFGTPEGLIMFHPDDFPQKEIASHPVVTHLEIMGQRTRSFFNMSDTLFLTHHDHYVSLGVSCLSYRQPPVDRYFFRLKGLSDNWIETSDNSIIFSNLEPGTYQLFVSTVPGDNTLVQPQLEIVAQAAFWQTTLFKALIVLLVGGVIAVVFYIYVHQLKLKNQSAYFEQRLLLSQMNPHFIYNSLSAIQNFIYKSQAREAGNYLSDFSRLMRNILENSRSQWITLKKELDTLELYLRLQKLRFPDKLYYRILVAPDLIPASMLIPPMLIQPFVENAIEHGILHKKGAGNVSVEISAAGLHLQVMIKDDGIGIDAAQKLKPLKSGGQRSFATLISLERMAGLRKSSRNNASLEVLDRISYDGKPGTVVIQKIPFQLVGHFQAKSLQ